MKKTAILIVVAIVSMLTVTLKAQSIIEAQKEEKQMRLDAIADRFGQEQRQKERMAELLEDEDVRVFPKEEETVIADGIDGDFCVSICKNVTVTSPSGVHQALVRQEVSTANLRVGEGKSTYVLVPEDSGVPARDLRPGAHIRTHFNGGTQEWVISEGKYVNQNGENTVYKQHTAMELYQNGTDEEILVIQTGELPVQVTIAIPVN